MMFPLVLRPGVAREPLLNTLEAQGIETRYLMPLLNQPYYRRVFGNLEPRYPVATHLNTQGFYIGCHQGLGREDLEYVVAVLTAYFRTAPAVTSR